MTRLLLCTAMLLALTASANAQSTIPTSSYFGGGGMDGIYRQPYPSSGCWTAYGCELLKQPQARGQRNKKKGR
jgi:hypothetical protein